MNRNAWFYCWIQVWHYDESTNSNIEVGFGGMKHLDMPVNPQHSVPHSASLNSGIENVHEINLKACHYKMMWH